MRIVVGIALATALIGSFITPIVMRIATFGIEVPAPFGVPADRWRTLTSIPNMLAGVTLGFIERLIFFVSFWLAAYVVIVSWLTFKLGSKWEAWQNVIKVPTHVDGIDDLEFAASRRAWGSSIFMRSLIGTGVNLLIAAAGAGIAELAISR